MVPDSQGKISWQLILNTAPMFYHLGLGLLARFLTRLRKISQFLVYTFPYFQLCTVLG